MAAASVPAVDGWFTTQPAALIGLHCGQCGTYVFPPRAHTCPNPRCRADGLDEVELSRRGRVWSYATNHYPPPEPYVADDPFEPVTVAAVELADEQLVVLGQLDGDPAEVSVGTPVHLAVDTLFTDDQGTDQLVWKWRPGDGSGSGGQGADDGGSTDPEVHP